MLQVVGHHIGRIRDIQDDSSEAGHSDLLRYVLHDGDGLPEGVHPGLTLAHIRQGAGCHDHQLGILCVGIIPCPDDGTLPKVNGGIEQIQRLSGGFLLVHVNVDDLVCDSLRNQGIACVGANVTGSDDDDFPFLNFHLRLLLSVCFS